MFIMHLTKPSPSVNMLKRYRMLRALSTQRLRCFSPQVLRTQTSVLNNVDSDWEALISQEFALKGKYIALRLGVAFALRIAILPAVGQLGLRWMQTIHETLIMTEDLIRSVFHYGDRPCSFGVR